MIRTLVAWLLWSGVVAGLYAAATGTLKPPNSDRRVGLLEDSLRGGRDLPETDTEYRTSLLTIATTARRLHNTAEWAAITRDRGDLDILARYVDGDCYRDTCNANGIDPLADKAAT